MRGLGYETYLVRPVRSASLVRVIAGQPTARKEIAANDTAGPERDGGTRKLSVLVAEDNEINALLVRSALTRAGHRVTVVGDGDRRSMKSQAQVLVMMWF